MKLRYIVKKEDDFKQLKYILKKKLYISNTLLIRLKKTQSIFINNQIAYVDKLVGVNDIILIDFENMVNTKLENHISFYDKYKLWDNMLDIIYEDKFLLIINKSAGVTIHPVSSEYEKTLSNAVMSYLISENKDLYKNENIHIITRLDKDTSGICIFAKNSYIQELFTNRKDFIDFKKEYITVVDGIVKKDHDIVEKNISRKPDTIILRQVSDLGDFAKTEYFVEKRNFEKNYTILKVFIYTGRTHQIRVHLSSIGHPILGDELYANEYNVKNINKYIDRQALHCYKVSFNHPITGKKISIKADIPYDINQLIQ